ncbi:DUF5615 family PIN-like protein [candidate division KSB1 bacterium]|nr:DUF5615 family PIN-like protein [candidate division KSB1 bacterium]
MKILIDMNLSPSWINTFEAHGWQALHWSSVGDPRAADIIIMDWARKNGYVVFTHDLDFGILLATTGISGPSVIQIRTEDVMPQVLGHRLVLLIKQYESMLKNGALITVDERKSRVRVLPFHEMN